jgi:hypothetical protein
MNTKISEKEIEKYFVWAVQNLGGVAYKFKSPQYVKARDENFTPYERKFYNNMRNTVYDSMYRSNGGYAEPPPWTHFENVKAYGEPSWASKEYQDIGRQRYYSNVD